MKSPRMKSGHCVLSSFSASDMSFKLDCFCRIDGMRLFCKSSSMMDKQTLIDVYLNALGITPFTNAATDATNNLDETIIE